MAEMVGWLRKGVGELMRQAGLQLMELVMDPIFWTNILLFLDGGRH
jgi:hypothetical protein